MDDAAPWPVSGPDLRRRPGDTYWDDALRSAGLKVMHSQDLFHHDDFVDALDAFVEEAPDMELPFTLGSYDTWYIAEQACSQNRPSAVEVIQRFGTWESALRLVGGPPEEKEDGTRICPVCGKEAWPIVRGMWFPDPDNLNPKVIQTGCVITDETPKHRWAVHEQLLRLRLVLNAPARLIRGLGRVAKSAERVLLTAMSEAGPTVNHIASECWRSLF